KLKDMWGSEQVIKSGDWLMGVVWSEAVWPRIKDGTYRGYSLQGYSRHEDASAKKEKNVSDYQPRFEVNMESILGGDAPVKKVAPNAARDVPLEEQEDRFSPAPVDAEVEALNERFHEGMTAFLARLAGKATDATRTPANAKRPNFEQPNDDELPG